LKIKVSPVYLCIRKEEINKKSKVKIQKVLSI